MVGSGALSSNASEPITAAFTAVTTAVITVVIRPARRVKLFLSGIDALLDPTDPGNHLVAYAAIWIIIRVHCLITTEHSLVIIVILRKANPAALTNAFAAALAAAT
eukprot:CAMPEP_0181174168 /NCGR_PEP_ID=MMETSP1096-20121128/3391_1 /TAXON_ID=156174 ORGANISM="Chrysochromulina ericina, Strain CCMP281" /NCGR_SAMPLE_ID=MMETSP1096 /ASSEMBLY_ACC=CAM_ASM_000453 /LENGTH=105 /DNA_ID=CAMNT_0023262049 /DNA_START=167 /DNA_END=481 /DNA_ORIENTATION=+